MEQEAGTSFEIEVRLGLLVRPGVGVATAPLQLPLEVPEMTFNLLRECARPCRVMLFASALLGGCGGGEVSTVEALQAPSGRPNQSRILSAGASDRGTVASASAAVVSVVKYYNLRTEVREAPMESFKFSIALLDAAGVPFQVVNCGIIANEAGEPFAGTFPPSWALFSIAAGDLAKAKIHGFEEFDPSLKYTFVNPQSCGDRDVALSASSRIIGYARVAYPDLFPGPSAEGSWNGYSYGWFGNGNYVGVKGSRVFVHNGRDWMFLDVGAVGDYIKGF